MSFQGKGSWQRPTVISRVEKDLRWELIKANTSPERKQEIIDILAQMQAEQSIAKKGAK
jgi:hypothetical protein